MTIPTPSSPGHAGTGPTTGALSSPRTLAAWALLGYAALHLFFAFFQWVLPSDGTTFTTRSLDGSFRSLTVAAMPVLAVLLAVHVTPALRSAKTISAVALVEYLVALLFGIVTLLVGMGRVFDGVEDTRDGFSALEYLVMGLASLTLIAVAAYVVARAFRSVGGSLPIGR